MICFYRITEDENFYEATIEQMTFEGSEVVATGRFESFKDMARWANSHGCTKALMRE